MPTDAPRDRLEAFCRRWRATELAVVPEGGTDQEGEFADLMVSFEEAARPTLFDLMDMEDELSTLFNRKVHLFTRRGLEMSGGERRRESFLGSARVIFAR